jgi:hypothetical protein
VHWVAKYPWARVKQAKSERGKNNSSKEQTNDAKRKENKPLMK